MQLGKKEWPIRIVNSVVYYDTRGRKHDHFFKLICCNFMILRLFIKSIISFSNIVADVAERFTKT